ncbi:MAG: glutamyl-tRNA reductase [Planctomycetes bacterium]|nr:glutamyl-tRNA reductase [Planctomycetota bacterium]
MILLAVGCNYHKTAVELRERLAFDGDKLPRALDTLIARHNWEAVILSTCNRVELYLGHETGPLEPDEVVRFLSDFHGVAAAEIAPHLYVHRQADAVHHLFRVTASLDSMIVGEAQISGQVKKAYEVAHQHESTGRLLNALFQHARQVAKRVRSETGIAKGHVSVSSAAVDYVRQVFDHFSDKTVLVIGAGKMGELTLRHLKGLNPQKILVTNRSPEKAQTVAKGCGGEAVAWDRLDEVLARADIVLSTTGAPEPIVTRERYQRIVARRTGGTVVILDIAVPRDFDPRIHDGDRTCLFNIDDLKRIREATLADRLKHVAPAEAIVEQEMKRFLKDLARLRNGPVIERLTKAFEEKRQTILANLFSRQNGKLADSTQKDIEGAFRLFQNWILHGPITALTEETHAGPSAPGGHTLLGALLKLFRLEG